MRSAMSRRFWRLAVLAAGTLPLNLCFNITGENSGEFRRSALPGVETGIETIVGGLLEGDGDSVPSGLESILNGLLDGVFVVLRPD